MAAQFGAPCIASSMLPHVENDVTKFQVTHLPTELLAEHILVRVNQRIDATYNCAIMAQI